MIENQVRVGDGATLNGTGGVVEAMTLRTIVLRDLSAVVHVFPNGSVNTLSNATRGWSAYVFDIGIAYKEDPDAAITVIRDTAFALHADPHFGPKMIAEPEIFGVDRLDDSAVVIRGRLKTQPIMQWEVGREFLKRVKAALDRAGIEMPYPHCTLYFGDARAAAITALRPDTLAPTTQAREDVGE